MPGLRRKKVDGQAPFSQHRVQAAGGAGVPGRGHPSRARQASRHLAQSHPCLGRQIRSRRLRRGCPGCRPPAGIRGKDRRAGAPGRPAGSGDRVSKGGLEKRTAGEKRDYVRHQRPRGLSVSEGCRLMGLPRSTFYAAPTIKTDDAEIVARIAAICEEFECYGYRRVGAELRHQGIVVNAKRIRRITREHDLQPKRRRLFVATTDSAHDQPIFANLTKDLLVDRPNQLWVADITYVAIAVGFVYVAVILDAWSRRVVGYAISKSIDARLTLAALKAAIRMRQPPNGCIHHSDRAQYASQAY